ncbi:Flp family type IVb pilin [Paraburkholderia sp. FT54]|jgi:pilus assembly protein Flp/PilA|uniref:Flp family type IVb pilin n=1 Tax=Paraburkholderia sp. FT54 TaxID=3074437 RepID=UPI002877A07E|nr:Flp family type IVb pilin [Paraburkholderia sp. FT54]WNC93826.1 Flp family type IVb pilin [Paraburkholderia sp. FT54]
MKNTIQQFLREEDGVAAIEYGLLAGLIAVAIIVAVTALGARVSAIFGIITASLAGVVAPA